MTKLKIKGFTLVEVLVVIAIIATLSAIVVPNVLKFSDDGKIAAAIAQMKQVHKAVLLYIVDTGQLPPDCRLTCTASTDPLLTNPGVSGWNGPYIEGGIWNMKHPWGGHIGIYRYDSNGNGKPEIWVILDDDAPGTNASDNSGKIPSEAIREIDKKLDDGNPSTGNLVLGDGSGSFATGEVAWMVVGSEL